MTRSIIPLGALALALAACSSSGERSAQDDGSSKQGVAQAPGDTDDHRAYTEIGAAEVIRFTGTEPFWGGQVSGSSLTYSTPENPAGSEIAVERFGGRGGLSFSGRYRGAPFDIAITPGKCSDGMSDRTYPFVVTLEVEGEQRAGCAWTEAKPYTAPPGYEA